MIIEYFVEVWKIFTIVFFEYYFLDRLKQMVFSILLEIGTVKFLENEHMVLIVIFQTNININNLFLIIFNILIQ